MSLIGYKKLSLVVTRENLELEVEIVRDCPVPRSG